MKLVTFWANNLTNSENRNMPLWMFTAVNVACNVAIVSFSSSVICFATTLFILVSRTLLIFSHVSPYLNVSRVKESTHAKIVVLGNRVAVSISPHV